MDILGSCSPLERGEEEYIQMTVGEWVLKVETRAEGALFGCSFAYVDVDEEGVAVSK